jgi:hypothetical protein
MLVKDGKKTALIRTLKTCHFLGFIFGFSGFGKTGQV